MKNEIPPLPKPPLCRIIREGSTSFCSKCGSSIKKTFWLRQILGCIQPLCIDYYLGVKIKNVK